MVIACFCFFPAYDVASKFKLRVKSVGSKI